MARAPVIVTDANRDSTPGVGPSVEIRGDSCSVMARLYADVPRNGRGSPSRIRFLRAVSKVPRPAFSAAGALGDTFPMILSKLSL
jgi:hypothetical protein